MPVVIVVKEDGVLGVFGAKGEELLIFYDTLSKYYVQRKNL